MTRSSFSEICSTCVLLLDFGQGCIFPYSNKAVLHIVSKIIVGRGAPEFRYSSYTDVIFAIEFIAAHVHTYFAEYNFEFFACDSDSRRSIRNRKRRHSRKGVENHIFVYRQFDLRESNFVTCRNEIFALTCNSREIDEIFASGTGTISL